MITRRTLITTLALGATSTLALAACGQADAPTGSATDPVTLRYTWWGNEDRAERTQKAIDLFEAANPDIKINGNFSDGGSYFQQRATEAAGGGLPDVMQFDLIFIRDYAQRNQLLDLGTVAIDTSGFDKSLLPSGQVRGKTYGIPNSTNAFGMFYDPKKLAAIGVAEPDGTWNYTEYKNFLKEVGAKGNGEVYGSADFTGIWWHFNIWLRQENIAAFTDDGKLGFTKDHLREWWNLASDLRGTPALVPEKQVEQVAPMSPFGANLTASEMYWDNLMSGYMADSGVEELKLVPPPSNDPDNIGVFLKPSQLMVASANTKYRDQAGRFIDFMVNSPEVGEIFKTSRGIPASSSQRNGLEYTGADAAVVAYEESISGYLQDAPEPPIVGFGTLETTFKRINSELNFGKFTVDSAVDQWFKEAEDLISQNG